MAGRCRATAIGSPRGFSTGATISGGADLVQIGEGGVVLALVWQLRADVGRAGALELHGPARSATRPWNMDVAGFFVVADLQFHEVYERYAGLPNSRSKCAFPGGDPVDCHRGQA